MHQHAVVDRRPSINGKLSSSKELIVFHTHGSISKPAKDHGTLKPLKERPPASVEKKVGGTSSMEVLPQ